MPESNPFPLAQSKAAAAKADSQRNRQQSSTPSSASSTNRSSSTNQTPAAQSNPFPEAESEAAAKRDRATEQQNSGNSRSGSASVTPGGYSSSNDHLSPQALGQGTPRSSGKMDTYRRDHTLDGRIEDDLQVADFYMKNGNYRGALLRYQDALKYDSRDDAAMFGLGEAMCKQNETAAAMVQFRTYLKSAAAGKYASKAEKMLSHPQKCERNR